MAKLHLTFEGSLLHDYTLADSVTTIGRLPDNYIQIDNLAVSGHHARIVWEADRYVIEDAGSLNGTYVNRQRVARAVLNDGDQILVGKHVLQFKDEWHDGAAPVVHVPAGPAVPKVQETVVLDTRRAREMMAQARAAAAGSAAPLPEGAPAAMARTRLGVLTVLAGKTDAPQYELAPKLTVVGKSQMASIKLKGWFAPKVAAQIAKVGSTYLLSPGDASVRVKVNGEVVGAQRSLTEGDVIEVAGVKFSFTLAP